MRTFRVTVSGQLVRRALVALDAVGDPTEDEALQNKILAAFTALDDTAVAEEYDTECVYIHEEEI